MYNIIQQQCAWCRWGARRGRHIHRREKKIRRKNRKRRRWSIGVGNVGEGRQWWQEGAELVKGSTRLWWQRRWCVPIYIAATSKRRLMVWRIWGCAANWAALTRIQNALLFSLSLCVCVCVSQSVLLARTRLGEFVADNLRGFRDDIRMI